MLLVVSATISESRSATSAIMNLPLRPQTALMLGFFRFGLFQFVLLLLIFYSGTLIHREREHGLHEIVSASPYPDWLMVLSKTCALCGGLRPAARFDAVLHRAAALAGHADFELASTCRDSSSTTASTSMLCVLAIVIQVLSPGKWSGMVLVVGAYAALLSMESLGLEDLLYGFRIPFVVYSDMNGFGHFQRPTFTLIAYWAVFCVLLLVLAQLFFPRGYYASVRERVHDARARMTPHVTITTLAAAMVFAGIGGWIYYNTHVLNHYETTTSRLQKGADYERRYGASGISRVLHLPPSRWKWTSIRRKGGSSPVAAPRCETTGACRSRNS